MKKYIRSERANLFEPNVYISMIVKLSGEISKEEIQHAVEKAYEASFLWIIDLGKNCSIEVKKIHLQSMKAS